MKAHGITPTMGQRSADINEDSYYYYLRSHDGERENEGAAFSAPPRI